MTINYGKTMSHSQKRKATRSLQQRKNRTLRFENLEDRRVFAASILASIEPAVRPDWFAEVRQVTGTPVLASAGRNAAFRTTDWIIQLKDSVAQSTNLKTAHDLFSDAKFKVEVVRGLGGVGQLLMRATASNPRLVSQYLSAKSSVSTFALDRPIRASDIPNDPLFAGSQWGLNNTQQQGGIFDADIDAVEAWDITKGNKSIVVGVIDTGIDYRHPDLAANMWRNPGEIAGNGRDDDGNGFTDDVYGYDFVNNDGDPMDDQGHGTHVSGTIAASGNNGIGVTGVAWNASLMALKVLDANGSGVWSNAIRATQYSTMMKSNFGTNIRATNNSYGGTLDEGTRSMFANAINAGGKADILFVAAAGNDGRNINSNPNDLPSIDSPYMVVVGATNSSDRVASFSNVGAKRVDLFAPGERILSTTPNGRTEFYSGTSMATPHVVGAAVLGWSVNPSLNALQMANALNETADKVPALKGTSVSEGRLNANNLVRRAVATASISDVRVTEGNGYFQSATFEIVLSDPSKQEVSFDYKTIDGTAVAGRDYQQASGRVTIPAGATKEQIKVVFWGNQLLDNDRSFQVQLSNPVNVRLTRTAATATIVNDDVATSAGVFRAGTHWYLDNANNGNLAESVIRFGLPGDISVVGDWDGDGFDNVGIVRAGANGMLNWYLDTNGDLNPEIVIAYGLRGDKVVVGDWDGDGKDNVGVVRAGANGLGQWLLDTDRDPTHEIHFEFGFNSDQPVAGDWNGDGIDDAGVARKSAGLLQWFLDTNRDPWADRTLNFGFNTDVPIVGDWNGDGRDEVGVVRNNRDWYLDVGGDGQFAERVVSFGLTGDVPTPGKWRPVSTTGSAGTVNVAIASPVSNNTPKTSQSTRVVDTPNTAFDWTETANRRKSLPSSTPSAAFVDNIFASSRLNELFRTLR